MAGNATMKFDVDFTFSVEVTPEYTQLREELFRDMPKGRIILTGSPADPELPFPTVFDVGRVFENEDGQWTVEMTEVEDE